jgi:hypothetical protein
MTDSDLSSIVLQHRLHDSINLVVAELLKRGGLFQYDSALARQLPNGKHATAVTLIWLESYIRERFQFLELESGDPVDLPPSLAKFVLARWNQFPTFRYEPTNPTRRRQSRALNK